jgi:plastocyanin
MEERETQARRRRGGRGSARLRWLALATTSAAVVAALVMAAPAGAADTTVFVRDNFFDDATVEVFPNDTVTWTHVGTNPHNVIFDDGVRYPPSGSDTAWSFPRTFTATGTYPYHCSVHPGMDGTVTVSTPPADPPPGDPPPPGGGNPPPPGGGDPPGGGGGSGGGGGGSQPGGPSTGSPGAGKSSTKVTLKVSDATPDRGDRVRFFGTVRPAQDGRLVQLQRRVGRSYRTVAKIKLTDAGSSRSQFSKRIRVLKDSVFRARLPGNSAHAAGASGTKRVNVR